MNEELKRKTLPTSPSALSELLDSCAAIKRRLVGFVSEKCSRDVRAQLATFSEEVVTEREIEHAIEAVIGTAVGNAIRSLVPIIAEAPADAKTRDGWLDWCRRRC